VLPGSTRVFLGVEDQEVPAGLEPGPAEVETDGKSGLATPDDGDVDALVHVSA
jgi:hypothetical protein